jgi:hypothetical protein
MAENHDMYFPGVPGAPPAPPAPGAPPAPPVVQQPVENDNNIVGEPHQQQELLFIGPHNLVGPRLPPIDNIVENDPEIIRICNELATIINKLVGNYKENLMNLAGGITRAYNQATFQQQQYSQPPLTLEGFGNVTLNTILEQIKFYARMATHPEPNRRNGFNFQAAIVATENSIQDVLTERYNRAVEQDNINMANSYGFMSNPNPNKQGVAASVTLGAGSIGGIFMQILQNLNINYGGIMPIQDVRNYSNLILQLYRRIQAILVENGFQQGGKKKKRRTKKRIRVNTKQSKKQRIVNNKQSKNKK